MQDLYAGWHLTFDGLVYPEHSFNLNNVEFLERNFLGLVKFLDMEILVPPQFKTVPLNEDGLDHEYRDDGGITGTCIITTSHLSIHTWPLRHRFSLDIFSCKSFQKESTIEYIKNNFFVRKLSTNWIIRQWP